MDHTRLDTLGVIMSGTLSRPLPKTAIPEDRETFDPRGKTRDEHRVALEAGMLLDVPEYYGCVHAWKDGKSYRGTLLQYRRVTEDPTFDTADELLDWFDQTVDAVAG